MKRHSAIILLACAFIAVSALLYFIHYLLFHDAHHIFIYLLSDFAFLPLEVFFVVVVFERILAYREKQAMLKKLNMVIGAFFSEVGSHLLHDMLSLFEGRDKISQQLLVNAGWKHSDFKKAMAFASSLHEKPDFKTYNLDHLKDFMVQKRGFLLRLLENPNLLEHERFTDLLWATFHLTEELEQRDSFSSLPPSDLAHIAIDIQRVYRHLTAEWLLYVEHLKADYPYLFSLVVRMNPFIKHASAIVNG